MKRICLLAMTMLAACSSVPSDPEEARAWRIQQMVRALEDETATADRLIELGDEAVPTLAMAVRYDKSERVRERCAFILGRIHQKTRTTLAPSAYLDAIRDANPALQCRLLAHAHLYSDRDGEIVSLLHQAITDRKDATADMLRAAAIMTEVESLKPMTFAVIRARHLDSSPERDLAIRYLGRAARKGRSDAAKFLIECISHGNEDLAAKAGEEMRRIAGRVTPRNWREWWLDHAARDRRDWLVETLSLSLGALDLGDRAHVGRLIDSCDDKEDREPEFWLLEQVLDRRFGYVSLHDVFDPGVTGGMAAEGNAKVLETLRAWWRESSPFLYFNPGRGGFEINEDARKNGTPVHPKTGEPEPR